MRDLPFFFLSLRCLIAASALALAAGCASLPDGVARPDSRALPADADTALGRSVAPSLAAHPGRSGVHAIPVARDAFAARVLAAQAAERTLDLQYYIWHDDITGRLLWHAVWEAAGRGVRVRLLLDDANTAGLDDALAALDAHPNIEVRLFNPFANRGLRLADFVTDFARVNRRMHNKSFTADNQVTLVGGRNVGDEYFGADLAVGFQDLDVLAVGPVVRQVSDEFDLFWNSEHAWPAAALLPPAADPAALRERWAATRHDPQARDYVQALRAQPLARQMAERSLPLEWTTATVFHDSPEKVRAPPERDELMMFPRLMQAMGRPARQLDMVSPYFVPGPGGSATLAGYARDGVRLRILTNSLSATDVGPVHAGYSRYRGMLLEAGVELYELEAGPAVVTDDRSRTPSTLGGVPGGSRAASAASLHAKTFAVDRQRIFVGSFNLDPRSARLNTEMGLVIDSPTLAAHLSDQFERVVPAHAYRVRLDDTGALAWTEQTPQGPLPYTHEPRTGLLRRAWVRFLSILPIESML